MTRPRGWSVGLFPGLLPSLLLALALLATGCADGDPLLFQEGVALEELTASEAEGIVGEAVTPPPRVRVVDGRGNPAPGVEVIWSVQAGDGAVERERVRSDRRGEVEPGGWTLGPVAGEQELSAALARGDGSGSEGVHFRVRAQPGDPDSLAASRIPEAAAPVGSPVDSLPQVTVRDRFGNPVPRVTVDFRIVEGDGTLTGSEAETDEGGRAELEAWTLGTRSGPERVEARVGSLPPLSFEIEATPAEPDTLVVEEPDPASLQVGQTLPPIDVEVRDRFGNPVPDVEVTARIVEGGGTVEPTEAHTDLEGRVTLEWTLGTVAGLQSLEVEAAELAPRLLEVDARAGPAHRMDAVVEPESPTAPGASITPPPAAQLLDEFDNPVEGGEVSFHVVEGEGEVEGTPAPSDAGGIAALSNWTAGPEVGPQRVEARHGDLSPVSFEVEAVRDEVREIRIVQGENQTAVAGFPVDEPPGVRLLDGDGARISGETITFTVVAGGGSVSPSEVTTNFQGRATASEWVLGPEPGTNRIRIDAEGAPSRTISAEGLDGFQIQVDAVHLNQGNQSYDGSVPLVEGRGGLLRVFLRASAPNGETPRVRVVVYDGSTQLLSHSLAASSSSVPTSIDANVRNRSWNVVIPEHLVRSGLGYRVVVDEDEEVEVLDRSLLRWPADGSIHRPQVLDPEPFRATFVRIESTDLGTVADLSSGNVDEYMTMTRNVFPIADFDAQVRPETYVTSASPMSGPDQGDGWLDLLHEIHLLRQDDGANDPALLERYYHGIVGRSGAGIAGLAYIAESPNSQYLAALSHDDPGTRAYIVAHEFGHNFGRRHAPCRVASNDPDYPYANARLGEPAYSLQTDQLISADGSARDIMSYCTPAWSSDYTFDAVLRLRNARPIGAPARTTAPAEGLVVWGSWGRDRGPRLRPLLEIRAHETDPIRTDATVRGYDAGGRLLFERGVQGLEPDHADDETLRHFTAVVHLPPEDRAALARVVLDSPEGRAELAAGAPGEGPAGAPGPDVDGPDPELRLDRVAWEPEGPAATSGTGRLRLRWNHGAYPQAVLRDGPDGPIVGIVEGGDITLPPPLSSRLAVQLSDGVRSLHTTLTVP
jgi:hypothetical protein